MTSLIENIKIGMKLKEDEIDKWEKNLITVAIQQPDAFDGLSELINQNKGYVQACEDILKIIGG